MMHTFKKRKVCQNVHLPNFAQIAFVHSSIKSYLKPIPMKKQDKDFLIIIKANQ